MTGDRRTFHGLLVPLAGCADSSGTEWMWAAIESHFAHCCAAVAQSNASRLTRSVRTGPAAAEAEHERPVPARWPRRRAASLHADRNASLSGGAGRPRMAGRRPRSDAAQELPARPLFPRERSANWVARRTVAKVIRDRAFCERGSVCLGGQDQPVRDAPPSSAARRVVRSRRMHGCGHPSRRGRSATRVLGGISFDYPARLHVDAIPVNEHYVQIIGYVSNERLHPPCTTTHSAGGTTVECGMPVRHLSPGGVLVTWSFDVAPGGGRDLTSATPGTATVVAGRPAKLYITSDPTTVNNDCYGLGAARFMRAIVRPPRAQSATLFMLACLDRGRSPSKRRSFPCSTP